MSDAPTLTFVEAPAEAAPAPAQVDPSTLRLAVVRATTVLFGAAGRPFQLAFQPTFHVPLVEAAALEGGGQVASAVGLAAVSPQLVVGTVDQLVDDFRDHLVRSLASLLVDPPGVAHASASSSTWDRFGRGSAFALLAALDAASPGHLCLLPPPATPEVPPEVPPEG